MSDDQKEEKPKKLFTVVHTVWDDGEIDTEMYEFRKNPSGRGAPGKWRLGAKDFVRRIEETLGDSDQISDTMTSNIGVEKIDAPVSVQKVAKANKDKPKEETSDKKDDSIEFGDFDK